MSAVREDVVAAAERVSEHALEPHAAAVDAENRFPRESVDALHRAGLLAFFVPHELGGAGGTYDELWRVAAALGEGCLSTAMVWAMHCQQVAALAEHAVDVHGPVLRDVVENGALIASVTTEAGKGGDLLTAEAPLEQEEGGLRLRRRAPVVSYGAEAAYFLITMRAAPDSPPQDVRLVLVQPGDGRIDVVGDWVALGMRGTRSVPMTFDVLVEPDRLIGDSFRDVALRTMIPAAHLGWGGAWYGAARGAFRRAVQLLRKPASASVHDGLQSERMRSELSALRVQLDLVQALLERVARRVDLLASEAAPIASWLDAAHNVELNNVKIAASELSVRVVDGLIELVGMREGYLQARASRLEQTFRDLRSASLMFSNERLRQANGRLLAVEDRKLPFGAG